MIWHNIQQNSEEREQLRLGKVTASNFGTIMANDSGAFGETAKRYALQLALEIINNQKAEYSFTNQHMERGHEQEPIARMLYENEYFIDVTNGGFFDCGDYGDSPDGLVNDDGVIEIKSVIASTHYATLKRKSFDPSYRWQLIGHLDCTGRDWVDFISYCSDFPEHKQLIVYRLNRSECEQDIERLVNRRKMFIELVKNTVKEVKHG
ncbi:YqaJ-like viral recombinase [Entomomonas moraniae]|uniref:YqaJ-like viral recombinase n=1 Tax=Entomomonas moraniae TaxID=2213226 RepID=A0A3S9XDC9_9GAMM|nr:lambda exonuclease family protein [Entomomonas moraniae]AZS50433.1 YqaJ-like viral recombinase [Entomomonas moraniae]